MVSIPGTEAVKAFPLILRQVAIRWGRGCWRWGCKRCGYCLCLLYRICRLFLNRHTAPHQCHANNPESDDGTVDVLPRLMPRVRKAEVESAVNGFCQYCESESVDGEVFARLHRRVKRLEFYLDEEQCRRVNESYQQEMDRRFAAGGFKLTEFIVTNLSYPTLEQWFPHTKKLAEISRCRYLK